MPDAAIFYRTDFVTSATDTAFSSSETTTTQTIVAKSTADHYSLPTSHSGIYCHRYIFTQSEIHLLQAVRQCVFRDPPRTSDNDIECIQPGLYLVAHGANLSLQQCDSGQEVGGHLGRNVFDEHSPVFPRSYPANFGLQPTTSEVDGQF
jgi:hypothetical protein